MENKFGTLCAAIVLLFFIFASFQSCSDSSAKYHERAKLCIQAGGSWIQVRESNDGICINGGSTVEK